MARDAAFTRPPVPPAGETATNGAPDGDGGGDGMPRVGLTRGRVIGGAVFVVALVAFLYFALPQIAGLEDTWQRIKRGDHKWLYAAAGFEVLAYVAYNAVFRTVMVQKNPRIDWRASFQITLASLLATRLFNAAGAGGVALTAWALGRSGMEARVVACRMVAFLVCLYSVYMLAMIVAGLGLYTGLLPGGGAFAITVVPAIVGVGVIGVFLGLSFLPPDLERRFARWAEGRGRLADVARRVATAPASLADGVRTAWALVRAREPGLLGAVGWWGFDMAVLWACFHAFGGAPTIPVVVLGYFVGMMGNLLPLPGGVGGVEGGMFAAFVALGVDDGLALVAVLSYRGFSFWLPTVPGAIAYLRLRRTVRGWRADDQAPSYTS
jgi:putative heme transporter